MKKNVFYRQPVICNSHQSFTFEKSEPFKQDMKKSLDVATDQCLSLVGYIYGGYMVVDLRNIFWILASITEMES